MAYRVRSLFLILLVGLVISCRGAYAGEKGGFSFIVMGDSRAERGANEGTNEHQLRRLITRVKKEKASFIVFLGDMICSSNAADDNELRRYFERWKSIMDESGLPVYISIGNEDIDKYGKAAEGIIGELFAMPRNGPPDLKGLAYSFDCAGGHFVVLDTCQEGKQGLIRREQVEWLKEDLGKNKGGNIFVFAHHPFFPEEVHVNNSVDRYPEVRDELWELFGKAGVRIYFCGHAHYFQARKHKDIFQIISGGAGAPLHDPSDGKGKEFHYCLVTVPERSDCVITAKDAAGKVIGGARVQLNRGEALK